MSWITDIVAKLVDVDSENIGLSINQRGSKGAACTEIVDSSGNQVTPITSSDPMEVTQDTATDLNMTEANSAAIKTAVEAVQTAVETIDNIVSGSEAQVDIVTMPDVDINDISKGTQTNDVKVSLDGETVDISDKAARDLGQVDIAASLPGGSNAIGKLAANDGVDIGDVDVTSTASGKTVERAAISAASSGDNTLVAAVAAKKIKVLSIMLIANGDVDVRFEDGAGGSALSGVMSLDASGAGFVLHPPANPDMHWIETSVNTLLNLELSAAVQVSGCITYYEEA